jgi:hypothetical protein
VHTLLRLPTGIFYAQGVKANVLFFDRKPASPSPFTNPPNYAILLTVEHRFASIIQALGGRRSREPGNSNPLPTTVRAFVLSGRRAQVVLHFAAPPLPGMAASPVAERAHFTFGEKR